MSLRSRIALLLIAAIVSVVGLATFAASSILRPPVPEATMEPLARQLHILTRLSERDREAAIAAGIRLAKDPATGMTEPGMSRFLTRAMEKTGAPHTAIVTRSPDTPVLTASVDIGNGEWLIATVPDLRPPPGGDVALGGWIILIVAGSTAISLYAASMVMKPLRLLEDAAQNVGADGVIAHVPETGSGEVRATAHALNQLSARLKSAMESRMRLVASAGHDLRTPMTRMRLRAEFIVDDDERAKWLADLEELDSIADSAIRLVREETGTDEIEPIELGDLVKQVVTELCELGHKVGLVRCEPAKVAAKPIALKRAIRNLMVNAATHGGGATVTLVNAGGSAVLTIIDQGPGIPENMIEQVFEPFFRVDPGRRKTLNGVGTGAGLGLAIAHEIVERFGGTIVIANNEPTGLIQVVELPPAAA